MSRRPRLKAKALAHASSPCARPSRATYIESLTHTCPCSGLNQTHPRRVALPASDMAFGHLPPQPGVSNTPVCRPCFSQTAGGTLELRHNARAVFRCKVCRPGHTPVPSVQFRVRRGGTRLTVADVNKIREAISVQGHDPFRVTYLDWCLRGDSAALVGAANGAAGDTAGAVASRRCERLHYLVVWSMRASRLGLAIRRGKWRPRLASRGCHRGP